MRQRCRWPRWRRRPRLPAAALELLRQATGDPQAQFRPGQEDAIATLLAGPAKLLVVQRTGWGKSLVYFIAASLLRESGAGPALLVSPLLALMRNQVAAARRMGLRAQAIHSDNRAAWPAVDAALAADRVDLLLLSPERLAAPGFLARLFAPGRPRPALWVIDEAHCLSDWGHDFRPRYRLLAPLLMERAAEARILATTATVNQRVLADLENVLGRDVTVLRGPLARHNLALQVLHLPQQAERLAWLARTLPQLPGSGIVYTLTVADAERVAAWLQHCGLEVAAYTGRSGSQRPELEADLLANRCKALVATTALGMGFDKPDLAWVIHFQMPASPLTYYQQVGRAGRALTAARGVLLCGEEDLAIGRRLVRGQLPEPDEIALLLDGLAAATQPLAAAELAATTGVESGRVQRWLELLATESTPPVERIRRRWQATGAPLAADFHARIEARLAERERELQQMCEYIRLERGHMDFLVRALGGDGRRHPDPGLAPLSAAVEAEQLALAARWVAPPWVGLPSFGSPRFGSPRFGSPRFGSPREGWPLESADDQTTPAVRAQGRALAATDDGRVLQTIVACKARFRRVPEHLIRACRDLVLGWQPEPPPRWVTCIPSLRHPDWVPDLAWRVAAELDLPFHAVLAQVRERPAPTLRGPQSPARAASLSGSLQRVQQVPAAPVLLIDDLVYTGATLALGARLLEEAGAGPVWTLALASFVDPATGSESGVTQDPAMEIS